MTDCLAISCIRSKIQSHQVLDVSADGTLVHMSISVTCCISVIKLGEIMDALKLTLPSEPLKNDNYTNL